MTGSDGPGLEAAGGRVREGKFIGGKAVRRRTAGMLVPRGSDATFGIFRPVRESKKTPKTPKRFIFPDGPGD